MILLAETVSHSNKINTISFSGSGSTGVACIKTSRNFICIEQDDKFVEVSRERIRVAKEKYSGG